MAKRRERCKQLDMHEGEWSAFMAAIETKAKAIAHNRDRALTLMILAGKVAQYDPAFARALFEAVQGARREQRATRSALRAMTEKTRRE